MTWLTETLADTFRDQMLQRMEALRLHVEEGKEDDPCYYRANEMLDACKKIVEDVWESY